MITNSRGRLLQIAAKQTFCTSQVGNTACHSVWLLCDPAWNYLVLYCFQDEMKNRIKPNNENRALTMEMTVMKD